MITVDGRIFDTDLRWRKYCRAHNIKDPFKEETVHNACKGYKRTNEHG